MKPRILVAGIGNIFLGDDGFGVEVAQRLIRRQWPENVRVVDYGIRGLDLAFALMDDYDAVVLVDATPRGGAPGTLYTLELDMQAADPRNEPDTFFETHGMNPMLVLAMARSMGCSPKRVLLVGCEPMPGSEEEERMGLSELVAASLDEAVRMVESLVPELISKGECNEQGKRLESTANGGSNGAGGGHASRHQTVH